MEQHQYKESILKLKSHTTQKVNKVTNPCHFGRDIIPKIKAIVDISCELKTNLEMSSAFKCSPGIFTDKRNKIAVALIISPNHFAYFLKTR